MSQDYEIDIVPLAPEDRGGFAAIAPESPGCRSDGDTPEEAFRNGYDAVACWAEAAEEIGRPLPSPRRLTA